MAQFFINRPIFAWVLAIVIMLAGGLSIFTLPLEQYPDIAPPRVSISTIYTGASAETVENSVTQVIEQQLKGIDNLLYMGSSSDASGCSRTTLTFTPGTNIDVAQVQVQNKLQAAMNRLPDAVQSRGVFVTKGGNDYLTTYSFTSPDPNVSQVDIGDYLSSNLVDVIGRIDGVGDVSVFGTGYAMRIWMNPALLEKFALMPSDITAALNAQNAQVSAGQLGALPALPGQQINASITARTKLKTAEEFENILLKVTPDGAAVLLKDVARVELGADNLGITLRLNGKPGAGMGIVLADGANATAVADAVNAKLAELEPFFPNGLKAYISSDSTPFVRASIKEVLYALGEAIALVVLVMFLFLQNFRATLIPAIAVPVVLLGTMGVLSVAGYSINTLTMFALVLAIGLLVDDAIVVVENVERVMSEEGLPPKEATKKSMEQISGALVGIGLVLAAVFVPMGFLGGSTGVIYRQFTATIVTAMAFSVLVALILTPALCATFLKPIRKGEGHTHVGGPIGRFFDWFNTKFDTGSARYRRGVRGMLQRPKRFMLVYALLCAAMVVIFLRVPDAFLPEEDQGVLMSMVQAPVGSTQQRTMHSIEQLENHFHQNEQDNIESVFSVQGFSFAGAGQNSGMAFIKLKDWDERKSGESLASAIAMRANMALSQVKDAMIFVLSPPAIQGLGSSGGFSFYLKDNAGQGHEALLAARNQLLGMAAQSPLLVGVRPNGMEDAPQLRVTVDTAKSQALGLSMASINSTLATAWGGSYVDDFIDRGRVKRVYVQADAPFRMLPEDFLQWSVRNNQGQMVPFSAFASSYWEYGPPRLERYNGTPAMEIQGQGAPGVSSGDAMAKIEEIVAQLPNGFGLEWSGQSYQERQAGAQTTLLYLLSFAIVFLCLAALYESWSVPTAVLLVAPLGILGAALFTMLRGLERDVYFQVAMLTTIGLTSKNAVLIIEFAKRNVEEGMPLIEGTLQAVRDRLRPIIMTSLAFGFGVLPLAIATGAGSGAQRAIGTGVLGGMIVGTSLGVFFIPLFFVVVRLLFARNSRKSNASPDGDVSAEPPEPEHA